MSPRSRRSSWAVAFVGFAAGLAVVVFLSGDARIAHAQKKKAPAPPTGAPQAPTLTTPANLGAKRGESVELTLTGTNLADAVAVGFSCPGTVTIPDDNKNGTDAAKLRVKVELPDDCPIGMHTIRIATRHGGSNFRPFCVDELPEVAEASNNRTRDTAQAVMLPVVVTGRADPEAGDFFKVKADAGQTLTLEVLARRLGSPLDPIVVLHDAKTKREMAGLYADDTPGLQGDCRLTHTFKEAGEYIVEVRDTTFRGGPDFFYRLRIGEFPGATTAFPVAAQRGKSAKIGFAGADAAKTPAVSVKIPDEVGLPVVYVAPKGKGGVSGWPVPVIVNDWPEAVEQEPNNEVAKANKLPVPGGVSAKFEKAGDVDHFVIAGKKGQKLAVSAVTYEINSPSEVLIRVLDAKGAEVGRSNPTQVAARVEFTPADDGNYVIACEQVNFVSGPDEIYHLSVQPVTGDFDIVLALDRCEAPPGGGSAIPATVTRLNGYTGPVELSIVGDPALSGSTTLASGATAAHIPVLVKGDAKPGPTPFRVQGKATIDGKTVVRYGGMIDPVKAALGGMPNPPLELRTGCSVAVLEKPAFAFTLPAEPTRIEQGKMGKVTLEVARNGADGDITLTSVFAPAGVTATLKPIAKGQTDSEVGITVASSAAVGPAPLVLQGTTKVGGKDYVMSVPILLDIAAGEKTAEPKKQEEPKKEEPKKRKK